jgi:hypothetical protein
MITNLTISAILKRKFDKNDVARLVGNGLVDKNLLPLLLNFLATKTSLQDLLIFNNIKEHKVALLNRYGTSFLALIYKTPIVERKEIIDAFNNFKKTYLPLFTEDIAGFELAYKSLENGKLKRIEPPFPLQLSIINYPKLISYRIAEDTEFSPLNTNFREILIEPSLIDDGKIIITVTYRNRELDECLLNRVFDEVNKLVDSLLVK